MCAESMIPHAVVKRNVRDRCISGCSRGMEQTPMFVDNRPMTCNCRGGPTNRGIPAGWNMQWHACMLRGCVPRFSEYCRGDHTPMGVVDVNVASAMH